MAAVPFFIQSPDAGRYCHADPHQLDGQLPQRRAGAVSKSESSVDDDLPPLLELRDSGGARRTLNHVDMIAADRDPLCPSVEHLPAAGYRSSTAADAARTSGYPGGADGYYRTVSDFATGYQYPSSLIGRPFGNGYCRSAYADECARRYPIEPAESSAYFHPGSVQPPAWARLPVAGTFPFPVPQEFGTTANGGGRLEYRAATTVDCCRTDIVAERPFAAAADVGSSTGGHRRRSGVGDRSPPPLRSSATSTSCCRLDSTDGGTDRDRLVPSDDVGAVASSKSSATSTGAGTAPVVVYPWMRKLHSRANAGTGEFYGSATSSGT